MTPVCCCFNQPCIRNEANRVKLVVFCVSLDFGKKRDWFRNLQNGKEKLNRRKQRDNVTCKELIIHAQLVSERMLTAQ